MTASLHFMVFCLMRAFMLAKKVVYLPYTFARRIYWYCIGMCSIYRPRWANGCDIAEGNRIAKGNVGRKFFVMMHSGELSDLYVKCFITARLKCPDARIELFTDFSDDEKDVLKPYGINFHDIKTADFRKKKTALKVDPLRHMDLKYGDKVIISDLDVIYQSDAFAVFNNDFDVFFTTRHYEYHYLINSGIWGFRVNERTRRFIQFYIRQLYSKSWSALRKFRERFGRDPFGFDILLDQDFMCAVYENIDCLPEEIRDIKFYDAGYKYNFCPSYDLYGKDAVAELKAKIGLCEYVILHLKGELKQVLDAKIFSLSAKGKL